MTQPTTRLAIVCSLDDLQHWMDAYLAERGDGDDNQLLRQLVLSDLIEWLRQRQEVTDGGNQSQVFKQR